MNTGKAGASRTGSVKLEQSFKRKLWVDYVKPIGTAIIIALLIRQFVKMSFAI